MTAQEFAYWLQGYTELNGSVPSEEQWGQIKDHLQLVFTKVTPELNFDPFLFKAPSVKTPYHPPIEVMC